MKPFSIIKGVVWQSDKDRLDTLAARDVQDRKFASCRDAAKAYLFAYDGVAARDYTAEQRNNRLRDLARRIARKMETAT